jgi:hypothetical protein
MNVLGKRAIPVLAIARNAHSLLEQLMAEKEEVRDKESLSDVNIINRHAHKLLERLINKVKNYIAALKQVPGNYTWKTDLLDEANRLLRDLMEAYTQ